MYRRVILACLAALIASTLACGALGRGATTRDYRFEPDEGPAVAAELGALRVPENRGREGGRTLELRYVRFAASGADPGPPIVYLAGGPGVSATRTAKGPRFPLFMALREHGDVIAFDQRNTGLSKPDLDCDEPYVLPFDRPLDRDAAAAAVAEAVARCAARHRGLGADLAGYTTAESAADLEALRRQLGAERLTLWGISYGTHLALAYLKAYPQRVDRLILAGVEPLHHTLKLPSDQQRLLAEVSRRAAADAATGETVPDLVGSLERLLARLDREPARVTLVNPFDGQPVEVAVGGDDLRVTVVGMLRGPESFAGLPDLVARLERSDWLALALLAGRQRMGSAPGLMPVAMDCASGAGAEWLARIEREAAGTLLRDAINFPYPGICRGLEIPDLGDEFRAAPRSDVPALLISGTLDGRTPPSSAEAVAAGLSKSVHLVLEGAGHSDPLLLSSPQILETMHAFLAGEPLPDRRIEVPVPGFLPPREVATLPAELLQRYLGSYRIGEGDVRQVLAGGPVLFTVRGGGPPFPLRPLSESEFFYEGSAGRVRFELDAAGNPVAMTYWAEGTGEGERAVKVD
ncbi:MAG TPA: alpha/beta fold hydrolase [Thermoanaerobaculia bacterium]|nr:alpha/beta fold hydrolase [Thermoanaerobaculia bacterium]